MQDRMQQEILQQQRAQQQRQWQMHNMRMQFQQQFAQAQSNLAGAQFQQTRPTIIPNRQQTYSRNINVTKDNLQTRNTFNNLNEVSKLLNGLKGRDVKVNIAGSSTTSVPTPTNQTYKVSYESPRTTRQTPAQRGPIITEVDDDVLISSSKNQNDNNPVITEID